MIDLNNMTDLEKLSAYLDNELSSADRIVLEQRLAVETELQQALANLEQGNKVAQTYFSELDNKPLPMNLETMILNAKPDSEKPATIIDIFRRKKNTIIIQSWGLASAASVVFALGVWLLMPPTQSNINDSLLAVLNTQPSGNVTAVNPELKIEVLASYQDSQGIVCRSLIEHTPVSSNPILACFNNGNWQVDTTDLADSYQTASSSQLDNSSGLMTKKQEQLWLKTVKK
jgi:negative regulator of sigma E activity